MSRQRSSWKTWPQEPRQQKNQDAVGAVPGCVMQPVREGVPDAAAVPETAGRPAQMRAVTPVPRTAPTNVTVAPDVMVAQMHVLGNAKGAMVDALDAEVDARPDVAQGVRVRVQHLAAQRVEAAAELDAMEDAPVAEQGATAAAESHALVVRDALDVPDVEADAALDVQAAATVAVDATVATDVTATAV